MFGLRSRRSAAVGAPPERSLRDVLARLHLAGTARAVLVHVEHLLIRCSGLPLVGRRAGALLTAVQQHVRPVFGRDELLRVCSSLDEAGVPYFVGGGWGLDLLAGCETRRHADLDVCLEDFERDRPAVDRLLQRLGYHAVPAFQGGVWFPDVAVLEDGDGHRVEVVSVNWRVLDAAGELFAPPAGAALGPQTSVAEGRSPSVDPCTAVGSMAGRTLPTFSAPAQRLFHLGYEHQEHRPEDVLARDVLAALTAGRDTPIVAPDRTGGRSVEPPFVPSTLLLVPIFSIPSGLWRLCKQFGNDLDAVPPHVTLAYPFLPADRVGATVIDELGEIFGHREPFDFEMATVGSFGDEVVYLEPSRSEVFGELVATLQRTFPGFHPSDGAFDSVVPQVTLAAHGTATARERQALAKLSRTYLPCAARATHVWLMSNKRRPDGWSIERIFALGSGGGR